MDFHELPRRDLQALCKRNGIRANMTNVSMADALAALPAVDGIEEEEKKAAAVQAVAAEEEEGEGEMQGTPLPGGRGRGVALTPYELIILDDSEEDAKDLTPSLGVGRRRATRRARVEPVAASATRKRAATAEAVPARTTRARSQRTVVSAPEEEGPKAIGTPRRAVARKTSTEQEELEKGNQGDVSEDCVVDSSVQERQADVQQFQDSPIFRNGTVSSDEIHHAIEDTETVPVSSGEAAEKVDFTSGATEENEVPTCGGMLHCPAKAVEEKEPVATPAMTTRKRAVASMTKTAVEATQARTTRAESQRVVVSASEEEAPKAGPMSSMAVARKTSTEDTEIVPVISREVAEEVDFTCGAAEENEALTSGGMLQSAAKATEEKEPVATPATTTRKRAVASMAETDAEAVPARTTRARSQRVVVSAPEEEAPKERRTSRRAVARKTSTDDTEIVPVISDEVAEEVDFTCGAAEENEVPTSGGMLQSTAKAIEEEPVATPATTMRKRAVASMAKTAAEAVPAQTTRARSQRVVVSAPEEAPKARRTSRRAVARKTSTEDVEIVPIISGEVAEEVDFTCGAVEENEVPTSGGMLQCTAKAIEEEPVATPTTTMRKRAVASAKTDAEAVPARTTLARSQRVVVLVPEEEAPKARRMSSTAVARKTSTEQEEEKNGAQGDVSEDFVVDSSVEKRQVDVQQFEDSPIIQNDTVSGEEIHPASVATVDEGVMEVVTVDNLSQATVTDGKGVVEKSGFTADLTHVSIEEDAAVAADEMPLSLDESVKEEVIPVENLSQATLTDNEGAVKGSGFSCDVADVSIEEDDGVFAADELSQRSATLDENVKEEVATVENLSQATVTDDEWVVKENAIAGDLPPVVVTARGFSDHITSRLSAGMGETATKSMSIDSITEPVAVEQEKEQKEGKECEALGSLSLRKLRIKLKEKLAVAQENEADHVPLCMYSSSGGEKKASEPVAVEREEEMKEGTESEALGSLSLRKLRIQLKEKVAVPQENGVKEGKESKALDMLSLRKLKMKLKETLNAQKENR